MDTNAIIEARMSGCLNGVDLLSMVRSQGEIGNLFAVTTINHASECFKCLEFDGETGEMVGSFIVSGDKGQQRAEEICNLTLALKTLSNVKDQYYVIHSHLRERLIKPDDFYNDLLVDFASVMRKARNAIKDRYIPNVGAVDGAKILWSVASDSYNPLTKTVTIFGRGVKLFNY